MSEPLWTNDRIDKATMDVATAYGDIDDDDLAHWVYIMSRSQARDLAETIRDEYQALVDELRQKIQAIDADIPKLLRRVGTLQEELAEARQRIAELEHDLLLAFDIAYFHGVEIDYNDSAYHLNRGFRQLTRQEPSS